MLKIKLEKTIKNITGKYNPVLVGVYILSNE
jgi:hypothetical protein